MGSKTIPQEVIEREKKVSDYIEKYADLFDLKPDLVRGLITQESLFEAQARSHTGAYGYGQFTGIGARQVVNIAAMTQRAEDLGDFAKNEASDPDRGIKAICATLWWLLNVKYKNVKDPVVQLEAVLTFYNGGGRPAALVVRHGGHSKALAAINELPPRYRSQADHYAPKVIEWMVAWNEINTTVNKRDPNPFTEVDIPMDPYYKSIVALLSQMSRRDPAITFNLSEREGQTEITIIVPGELN